MLQVTMSMKNFKAVSTAKKDSPRRGNRIVRLFVFFLLAPLLSPLRCYQPEPVRDYQVTVNIFTHARLLLWSYTVTPSSVKVERFPTGGGPGEAVVDRSLTGGEKDRIGRMLAVFPLESLEERYADGLVTGNMHYTFDIRIGSRSKSVYVYYKRQEALVRLADEIDRLLPRYRIHYR